MTNSDEKTKKGPLFLGELPADHPIYKRGFVIGGRFSRNSSKGTPANNSQNASATLATSQEPTTPPEDTPT